MVKVTLSQLRAKRACKTQIDKFKELFGESVEVTLDLCVKHAQDFEWGWAAENLLGVKGLAEYEAKYTPIWAEYDVKRAAIEAEYKAKCVPIWAECRAKRAAIFYTAFEEYQNG